MARIRFLALCFLVVASVGSNLKLLASTKANGSVVSAMYLLGDSSVDCGENTPFYSLTHQNLSLYPCNGSDSDLLPQLLARKMGLHHPAPFYSQNGSILGVLSGVNFGSAQATILYPGSQSYQSLNQQLRQVFETIQLLQLHLGEEPTDHFLESSLFYLSFGKDDFINYLHNSSSEYHVEYNNTTFSQILVHQMTNAVRNLLAANVRKIICSGILPLGCAPSVLLTRDDSKMKGCLDEVNLMVLDYNTRLEEAIVRVNTEFPNAYIVFCDVYRAMMEFITNPTHFGIEDVRSACCGSGENGSLSGCISKDMGCQQASTHVWWDLYNPTIAINALIADSAWSGHILPAICRPLTVEKLASSPIET